ncbi:MAG: glycosyltransferase [Bacteroidota bacterium]|nr:glycosyltransferase [Bacteroidota bacterium]
MNIKLHKKKMPDSKRSYFFLILSCSGGAGHIRAAEALHRTAPLTHLPINTEHYNVLDFTSKIFKRLYSESYLQMVNRVPELWGYLYEHSERKPYHKKGIIKSFDRLNYKRYLRTLLKLKPDAIICTHFLPYISVSSELRKNNITAPVFAVTTDFDIHQLWVDPIIERYFVYHEESAWQLQSKKVPAEKITIAGIPLMPEFRSKGKQKNVRIKLGINPDQFTVLVLSGGFGIGRVKEIVEQTATTLAEFDRMNFNLLIVCGKNTKVQAEIQAVNFPCNINPYIYGFIDNMHEFMDASDLLISKAGGLTSSEAMAKSLPILIIDPIPGQESRNTDIIVEYGAGWKAINLHNLSYKLRRILKTPVILSRARKATQRLGKPNAASTILKNVYEYLRLKEK